MKHKSCIIETSVCLLVLRYLVLPTICDVISAAFDDDFFKEPVEEHSEVNTESEMNLKDIHIEEVNHIQEKTNLKENFEY